jgi:transcriptional regulator with XRE-family HTH domain
VTQEDWPARYTRAVADEVRRWRNAREMSAQQLADECTKRGVPIQRSVIANLESGRRPLVNVTELLAIAAVLDVPPLQLLVPLGHAEEVEIRPGEPAVHSWEAAQRFTGESPYPGGRAVIELFREHDRLVYFLRQAWQRYLQPPTGPSLGGSSGIDQIAIENLLRPLIRLREDMTDRGLTPPPWPDDIPAPE